MKKVFILLFVLLFGVSFVFAASGWGDTNTEDDAGDVDTSASSDDTSADSSSGTTTSDTKSSSSADVVYTQDFYIALGVAGGGILLALLFIYLFLRTPKNKWKKRPKSNIKVVKKPNSKIVKG